LVNRDRSNSFDDALDFITINNLASALLIILWLLILFLKKIALLNQLIIRKHYYLKEKKLLSQKSRRDCYLSLSLSLFGAFAVVFKTTPLSNFYQQLFSFYSEIIALNR
jgi:hypothetical protein